MSYDTFSPVADSTHSPVYPPRDPETGKFVPIGDHMTAISEAEMKEFFSRLTTNFVAASQQAQQLKQLQDQVHDLINKVEGLVADNTNLRNEVNSTYEFVRELEQENTKLKQELQTERDMNARHIELLRSRNEEIDRLNTEVCDLVKLSDERWQEIVNLRATIESLNSELANARYDKDYWKQQHNTERGLRDDVERDNRSLREEVERYKKAYDAMNAVLNPQQATEFRSFG